MSVDYRSHTRWQEELLKSHPEYNTNYPLKLKYTSVTTPKFNGKKKKSSNSGGVGKASRASKRRTAPSRGQCGYRT